MENKVNYNDWLKFYEYFVSMVWNNNDYSKEDQISLINKLLNATTNDENSIDIISAKADLRIRIFLLKLNNNQELENVKTR